MHHLQLLLLTPLLEDIISWDALCACTIWLS
jgi:hypothetical protein